MIILRYYLVNLFFLFTNTHKHLGVTLQTSGKWDVHIDEMISKTMKMIGVLRKMKYVLSRRCLHTMYISFIRPVLEYACVVWDSCSPYNANRLEKMQIEAAIVYFKRLGSRHIHKEIEIS